MTLLESLKGIFPHLSENILNSAILECGPNPDICCEWLLDQSTSLDSSVLSSIQSVTSQVEEPVTPIIQRTGIPPPTFSPSNGSSNMAYDYMLANEEEDYGVVKPSHKKIRPLLFDSSSDIRMKTKDNMKRYWVRFDNKIELKTHLQLLNLQVSKLSISSISLCSQDYNTFSLRDAQRRMGIFSENKFEQQERSNSFDGYWAHYIPVCELNDVWRNMVNAVIHQGRFDGMFELRCCRSKEYMCNFRSLTLTDEGMNKDSRRKLDYFPVSVVTPCQESKMRSVAIDLVSTLKIGENIFYRSFQPPKIFDDFDEEIETNNDTNKIIELLPKHDHLANAEYRMAKEKVAGMDHEKLVSKVGTKRPIWECHQNVPVKYEYNIYKVEGVIWKIIN